MSRKRKAKRKAWAYVKERNLSHLRFERRSAGSLPQDLLERYRQASELERGGTIVGLAQAIKEYQELVDHLHGYSGGSESATLCDLCLQGVARAVETLRGFLPATDPSYARAVAAAEELVRRRPRYLAAAITLARLLLHVGRGDEALRLAESAKPDRVELAAIRWAVLGSAYLQCGELKRAQDCLRRQLQQPIQSSEQRDNAALTLLLLGGYEEGWPAFRALHCERPTHAALRLYDLPQWDGGDLSGELLLLLDGGPGDVFMMTRWVSSVQARTQGLTLVGSPSLMDFCAGQFPNASVVSRGTLDSWLRTPGQASLDSFAAWAHSFALPDLLGISHPDGVRSAPYLRAPPEPFRPLDGLLRVGIRWAGWRHHAHDLVRSTRLTDWEPVLQVPGVRFFSLQLDEPTELCAFADRVEDLAPELVTWDRTAAAMMQLDLVISVDTSVAHLAGALGRPVWICLSADPEWRWMLERTDTPWYGSARLFRQDRVGNWVSVFEAVAAELRGLARDRQPLCA